MLGFFEWFTIHNNWVFIVITFLMWGILGMVHESGWKQRAFWFLVSGVLGAGILGGSMTYEGYRTYKNHYTTCSKPEAVNAFYVFDFKRERCLRPFVGFVPVNEHGNLEIKDAKKVSKQNYQLVNLKKEDYNAY